MLNERSQKRLEGVHPDLVAVVTRAAELYAPEQFIVTEGLRTFERQQQLLAEGKSKTSRSRHLTGHAVDLAIWEDRDEDKVVDADELSWKFPHYQALAEVVKRAAQELDVPITWGGDWKSFKDGPHFELGWKEYPL